jgi:hypothetical protein
MIFRVIHGSVTLDFGAQQSANQLLDNYPPHIREQVTFKEITAAEIQQSVDKLTADLRRHTRFDNEGNAIQTTYTEWVLSRLEMYEKALPSVQQYEANLKAKEESRINSGMNPVVNEVWSP